MGIMPRQLHRYIPAKFVSEDSTKAFNLEQRIPDPGQCQHPLWSTGRHHNRSNSGGYRLNNKSPARSRSIQFEDIINIPTTHRGDRTYSRVEAVVTNLLTLLTGFLVCRLDRPLPIPFLGNIAGTSHEELSSTSSTTSSSSQSNP